MSPFAHLSPDASRARLRHRFGLILLGCILLPATTRARDDLSEALRALFQAGVAAEKAGRLDEAEKDFQMILRQGGDVAFVHNNLGIVYQRRGDHVHAIEQFRKAIGLQPDYLAPRVLLGSSLLAMGRVSEAVRELERAVKLAPKQQLARLELAKAYEQANDFAAMTDEYKVLRELAPQDPEVAYQMGQGYLKTARWCLEQMRRLDPQSPRVSESMAEAYRAEGRLDQAIRAFQRAAQADPKLPGIHLALAQIYLEQRRIEDARREIELELAIVPEGLAAKAVRQRIISWEPKP
ncbi:MAG TPA: tetratricopeptide repeat protein [Terriglobia bacterium]|nr:tetratricopeptide repeat protein [Terriglobia bacterium]